MNTTASPRLSPLVWTLLGALALIWGTSFLSNRVALTESKIGRAHV